MAAPADGSAPAAPAAKDAPATTAAAPSPPQVADTDTPATGEVLPKVELSSEILFKVTAAELAFKRGDWKGPFVTMMSLAHQTGDPRLAHRAAEMALAAKQGGEAMAAIQLWRSLAPNSEEANDYFLGFIVLTDDIELAEPVFVQRLKDANPAQRGVRMLQMQQLLTRAKDKLFAYAMLERVLAPYKDTLEAHLVMAQAAFTLGETARAAREAQQALLIKPDSELAILTLAQVTADPEVVSAMLKAFLDKNPDAGTVRTAYARVLVDQQRFAPAREQFLILHKAEPDNVTTLYALGIVSVQLNDNAAAEGYFKQFLAVLAAHPKDGHDPSKVLMILSQMSEDKGDIPGALRWLDQIDASMAQDTYFSAQLRRAQLVARDSLDAGRKLLSVIKTDDVSQQTQVLLVDAQLLRDAGYDDTAFAVLYSGLQRFPNDPALLYDYALAAEKLDKLDIMEASLRQVIAQAPNNRQAYNALGYSFAERNIRLPEAYALIDQALKMGPDDPFVIDSMGWVQFRMGNLAQAEDLLRRAYTLRADPEIGVHLGEVLWVKGDKKDAHKIWREAQAKDPKNAALKSTLARLKQRL